MKDTPVPTVNRKFLHSALREGRRPDGGRKLRERRDISIKFGSEPGCCYGSLGPTKVLAQVSCKVEEPRAARPNEGQLHIQVDFLPTCAPRFAEGTTGSDEDVTEVSRLLERLLKESRCLDMESLCIVAEESVWCVRLDIHVLNHGGNVADIAGIAGLAALSHFRRPDATVTDGKVKIHSTHERDPIPLAIHHFPVCSTYAFFKIPPDESNQGEEVVVASDPDHEEEAVMDGKLVLGINPYREICTLHLAGHMLISKEQVLRLASSEAVTFAKDSVAMIKAALAEDASARKSGQDVGLANLLKPQSIMTEEQEAMRIQAKLDKIRQTDDDAEENSTREPKIVVHGEDNVVDMTSDQSDEDSDIAEVEREPPPPVEQVDLGDSDSEEEAVTTVKGGDTMTASSSDTRGWYKKDAKW